MDQNKLIIYLFYLLFAIYNISCEENGNRKLESFEITYSI